MDEKKNEEKTNQENINQENQEENSYEFLKETIKAKPVDTKKLAQYVGKLLLSGAVLGLTAAVVFALAAPPMTSKMIEKRNEEMVRFPQEKDGEEKGQTKRGRFRGRRRRIYEQRRAGKRGCCHDNCGTGNDAGRL